MSITEKIYAKIGEFLFEKEYKKQAQEQKKFNAFIDNAYDIAFLMPSDETVLREAINIPVYFRVHKKNVTLILNEHFINLIANKENYGFTPVGQTSANKYGKPDEKLEQQLKASSFDLFFDLTLEETTFNKFVALKINATYKIALFEKEKEKIYNMLLNESPSNNLENSFRNLLNSIRMF